MSTWNLRDAILAATHRWYVVVIYFLIGSLIGWLASYVCPAPYRATLDLHVGLNAYRSPYDSYFASVETQQYRTVDDYKNWQMRQLNDLVLTDDFLQETLRRLQEQDPYWSDLSTQDLLEIFGAAWRNVGEWHLSAEGDDPALLVQAVDVWSNVIAEWVGEAIEHSKQVVALDVHLTRLTEVQVDLEIRQETLQTIKSGLLDWQDDLKHYPVDQPVTSQDHWEMIALVSRAADWNLGWDEALEGAPPLGSLPVDYLAWFDRVIPLVDAELQTLPHQIETIAQQRLDTQKQYNQEIDQSFALASTLMVEKSSDIPPQVERVRPAGVLILVGGVVGLMVWGVGVFVRISREGRR